LARKAAIASRTCLGLGEPQRIVAELDIEALDPRVVGGAVERIDKIAQGRGVAEDKSRDSGSGLGPSVRPPVKSAVRTMSLGSGFAPPVRTSATVNPTIPRKPTKAMTPMTAKKPTKKRRMEFPICGATDG
jgi:hypothetical protein